ncbi:MAG: LysR family transcriptional regulator [Roseovarius sp.]|uniref:LysR family transcriptional regulator n=1 Tax=Roseovarius sp. TaxID=1486281 RepID=UPI0032EC79D2
MHELELRNVDLNLLVMLGVLLEERSVTRAAGRLNMSQPAVSRALGRLRMAFADPLLVEDRGGYCLSARAEDIQPRLKRLLADAGDLMSAREFVPADAVGTIRLLMPDLEATTLAPSLLARLQAEAPALDLEIHPLAGPVFEALGSDTADALIGVIGDAPSGIHARALYDDRYVTLMRRDHPARGLDLTLERYLDLGHIAVSVAGTGRSAVDEALAELGQTRRVQVRVPSFLAALEIAARSDLLLTIPSSLARTEAARDRLDARPPPLPLAGFTMRLLWHARHQESPRHIWLRNMIVEVAKEKR